MDKDRETIIVEGSRLPEYFREEVQRASVRNNIQLSENAEFYLVDMLTKFEKVENLFVRQEDHAEEEPLAMMLAHAISGDTATRLRGLKRLGDTALYVCGFFTEHVENSLVDVRYYMDMGSLAYDSLAGMLTSQKIFSELYNELSEKFAYLTDILGEISLADHIKTNLDILKLYERWIKTGDEHVRDILMKEGLIPASKIFC